jgi:hypothetical protein
LLAGDHDVLAGGTRQITRGRGHAVRDGWYDRDALGIVGIDQTRE